MDVALGMEVFKPVYIFFMSVGTVIGAVIMWCVSTKNKSLDNEIKVLEIKEREQKIAEREKELEEQCIVVFPTANETYRLGKNNSANLSDDILQPAVKGGFSEDSIKSLDPEREAFDILNTISPHYIRKYYFENTPSRRQNVNL